MKKYKINDELVIEYGEPETDPFGLLSFGIKIVEEKDCEMCKGSSLRDLWVDYKYQRYLVEPKIKDQKFAPVCSKHIAEIQKEITHGKM